MKRRTSLIIGSVLLLIAIVFIGIAFSYPELALPWSLRTTYMFYGFYVWLLFRFLLVTPFFSKKQDEKKCGSILRAIVFLLMAVGFFLMEITGDKVDIYTFLRGFVMTGSLDVAFESVYLGIDNRKCLKQRKNKN